MSSRASLVPRLKSLLVGIALIGCVMIPRLLNLDTFIGPDEKALWGWSNSFALAIRQGDLQSTLIGDGYPAVTLMWANTACVALKWLWLHLGGLTPSYVDLIGLQRPFELFAERRLFLALISGLQVLAAYPLLRRVWDRDVALVATLLTAIEPLSLSFTRMIRADALQAGFMWLSVLAILAFIRTGNRRYNWLAGAMGALAALSKLTGGIAVLIAVVVYAVVAWRRSREGVPASGRWLGRALLGYALPAAIVFFGLWPAWWFRPLDTFNLMWHKMTYHAAEAAASGFAYYFWGALHTSTVAFDFYAGLASLRLTPWLLVGTLVAVGMVVWHAVRGACRGASTAMPVLGQDPHAGQPEQAAPAAAAAARVAAGSIPSSASPYTLGVLFCVVTYWLGLSVAGQKIDRYFVPAVPGLAILSAIALTDAARWVQNRLPQRLVKSPALLAIPVVLGLIAVGHVAAYHPLYSTYYDPLLASPAFLQWAVPIGQGEGVDAALKYLSAQRGAADSVVLCGTNYPRCEPFFPGKLLHQEDLRTSHWFDADYVLWHMDEQQLRLFPQGVLDYLRRQTPTYVASYHGIEYTWLYPVPHATYHAGGSKLEGVATLLGYDISGASLDGLSPGDTLKLHLYWENEGQAADKQFYWRVVDEHGYRWSESTAQPLPSFAEQADQEGAIVEGEATLTLPPDMPPGDYWLKAGFADDRGDVGGFTLPDPGNHLVVTGASTGESEPSQATDTLLVPHLLLGGYDLSGSDGAGDSPYAPLPGETAWVTLHWQAIGQIQNDYTISLHLVDEHGNEMASWSGRPVYGTFPTDVWPADARVRDPWPITVPAETAPGTYRLLLSVQEVAGATESARVSLGTVNIVARRAIFEAPPTQFESDASFGDIAVLLGYSLAGDLLPDSADMRVELVWKALQATSQPVTVDVRLADDAGATLAEHSAAPADGQVSTTSWQPGEVVIDQHSLKVTSVESGPVNLEIRMLDAAGSSLPLSDGTEVLLIPDIGGKVQWVKKTQ